VPYSGLAAFQKATGFEASGWNLPAASFSDAAERDIRLDAPGKPAHGAAWPVELRGLLHDVATASLLLGDALPKVARRAMGAMTATGYIGAFAPISAAP